jgi:hypothetical protein
LEFHGYTALARSGVCAPGWGGGKKFWGFPNTKHRSDPSGWVFVLYYRLYNQLTCSTFARFNNIEAKNPLDCCFMTIFQSKRHGSYSYSCTTVVLIWTRLFRNCIVFTIMGNFICEKKTHFTAESQQL